MDNILVMQILDRRQHDEHQVTSFFLVVKGLLDNSIEELSTVNVLQNNVELLNFFEEIEGLHDVGMAQLQQDLNF